MLCTEGQQCNQSAALIAMTAVQPKVSFKGTLHSRKVACKAGRGSMEIFRANRVRQLIVGENANKDLKLAQQSKPGCTYKYLILNFKCEQK